MFYIYVLKSCVGNHYYTGQTDNVQIRLSRHNSGKVNSTKKFLPWEVIYTENYRTRDESLQREKYLKSHAGRNWLKK